MSNKKENELIVIEAERVAKEADEIFQSVEFLEDSPEKVLQKGLNMISAEMDKLRQYSREDRLLGETLSGMLRDYTKVAIVAIKELRAMGAKKEGAEKNLTEAELLSRLKKVLGDK